MEHLAFLRELVSSRRSFLGGLATGCVLPAALLPRDDEDDLAAAQRLYGLSFDAEQLQDVARGIGRARQGYADLRSRPISWWTAPAWNFDPLPPGAAPPSLEGVPEFAAAGGEASTDPADLAYASVAQLAGLLKARKLPSRKLTELCCNSPSRGQR